MEVTLSQLGRIIADYVQVGYNCAIADYDPPQDMLRSSDVMNWLKFRHIDKKTFKALVKSGAITARHSGTSAHSPLVYSKAEIQKAMATMRINRLFVEENLFIANNI